MADTKEFYERYWTSPAALPDPFGPTRIRMLFPLMRSLAEARVLDCGSGDGEVVAALNRQGFTAEGIEVSEAAIGRARQMDPGAVFYCHSLEDEPWPSPEEAYDVAISFDVIEHLIQPRRLVAGARRALHLGGHFAISTPYHGTLKNLAIALHGYDTHYAVEGQHIRFVTDRALTGLLEDCGFRVERLLHYGRFAPMWAGTFVWAVRT